MGDQTNEQPSPNITRIPGGTPRWVLVTCVLVGSAIIPLLVALSPTILELVKGSIEASKANAQNEKTALDTVLSLVDTSTKQVYTLTMALDEERKEKKTLTARVVDLEKAEIARGKELEECGLKLKICSGK